jgi:alanine racemase
LTLGARLTVDLAALAANWRALDARSGQAETAAVVKADGYGCGIGAAGRALAEAGARSFFVAQPEEGVRLRAALGEGPAIWVLQGYPVGVGEAPPVQARRRPPPAHPDAGGLARAAPGSPEAEARLFAEAGLRPVLSAPEQVAAWVAAGQGAAPAALQLDSGMNRLGLEASELAELGAVPEGVCLVMSHLACADEPGHPLNAAQLAEFRRMADGLGLPRSLAATGGTLLGPDFHLEMVRPGVGLYGGLPFADAARVVTLEIPILQVRDLAPGEAVGYGASWRAARPSRIATLSAGYADGLHRLLSNRARAFVGGVACPFAGRVSMDLIGLDVTDAPEAQPGGMAELLGPNQTVDELAAAAETIGYEVLTALGERYDRRYLS